MIKPRPLKYGDTIGVIAPSGHYYNEEKIDMGKKTLEDMGFKVKIGRSCYEAYGYLSGKDEIRAYDLNSMFEDKEIDGIICLRGGYGTSRILDKLDYEVIKKNPKVYVGFSDITATHIALNQICDLVTFHGPMVTSHMIDDLDNFTKNSLLNLVMGKEESRCLNNPESEEIGCLYGGKAEGRLTGGNLTLICNTLGTPYEIDTKGKILFIEEIREEPYRIDRMLTQLCLAGKLQDANGIILGDWKECIAERPERSLTLMQVFDDIIKPLKKPTIYNLKSGHCSPMMTLPMGVMVSIDTFKGEIILKEGATE
ncbi:S66 peptidase family protein [Paramaledivibacter caminithermalis]|jgi:muramoyltetrapeptide carboxypeptidase|uniref:Muramoyltetrapeptide carboxypeptidase n=1 Tax=Paramaledivibacter caminithermalis (strain DSM 15212 / CIP 107654 / DViRD3) TaxID=1121301 RepID=A0A1M6PVK8_PARC5|nr:LD-carboxypeptidase [Paramaledivibacter caminithermalis]SHK11942.1 muramoyltetrapeptide carboxypeptidase [Paramaledivibacter caminithermalis DSM 15212]